MLSSQIDALRVQGGMRERFDDVTLTGTRSVANNADCVLAPAIHNFPFTLKFDRPLPIPVKRYPLDCEPGGLRWCT